MQDISPPKPVPMRKCGAPTETRPLDEQDKALFEEFRDIIGQKIQTQFGVAKDFTLEPVDVRTQVVAGTNYYFHVRLSQDQVAEVKIFRPLSCHAHKTTDRSSLVTVTEAVTEH